MRFNGAAWDPSPVWFVNMGRNVNSNAPVRSMQKPGSKSFELKRKPRRRLLYGAAAAGILAITCGAFLAGWEIANQAIGPDTNTGQTAIFEIPVLDPLAGDVLMPDVRGLDKDVALQVIADAGMPVTNVDISTRPAAGEPGLVVSQTPIFGSPAPAKVNLVIADNAIVPDLVGVTVEEATETLSILGSAVNRVTGFDPDAAIGTVLGLEPKAGKQLPTQVNLTVNAAPSAMYLATLEQSEHGCSVSDEFFMAGQLYASGLRCGTDESGAKSAWLLAGVVERITGVVGIPDELDVQAQATLRVLIDGVETKTIPLAWGKKHDLDLRTSGALKMELVFQDSDSSIDVGLGDLQLMGDPTLMSRLGGE